MHPVIARTGLCLAAPKSAQINQDSGARIYKRGGSTHRTIPRVMYTNSSPLGQDSTLEKP